MAKRITYVFGADLSDLERSWKKIERNMQRLSKKIGDYGRTMSKAFTVPLAGIGTAAAKASLDVEKALATIARGTGAQGEDLKALENTWKKMAGTVTQSFEESAQVLADYNTRLGLTGDALADVSKKALDAARMMGEDVNAVVAQSAKAMQDWGVEAKDMAGFMDKLFVASQATGIQMSKLAEQLYKYGSPMRSLGFSLENAVALLAQFEKAGVNTELVVGALRQGLAKMAREGVDDAAEAFQILVERIKSASSDTEATRLAIETFGSRAGPDLAKAIREGRFSVEGLVKTLQKAGGIIDETSRKTETLGDKWAKTKNSIMMALQPLGEQIVNVAEQALPKLQSAVEKAAKAISSMSDTTKQKLLVLAGVMAIGGPLLMAISATINGIKNLGGTLVFFVANPVGQAIVALGILIDQLRRFYSLSDEIKEQVRSTYSAIGTGGGLLKDVPGFNEFNEKVVPEAKKAQKEVGKAGAEIEESIRKVVDQVNAAINNTTNNAIVPALEDIGGKTDDLKTKAEEAKRAYDELLGSIRLVQAEQAYQTKYEGAPVPTSTWKEQEWDSSEMEAARRIGQQVAATLDAAKQKTAEVTHSFDDLVTKSDMWAKSLSSGIADAIVEGRSLLDVLQQIGMTILKYFVERSVSKLIGGSLGGGLLFSGWHSGGVVGIDKPTFIRKYHTGGLVGSHEELAILQKGEGVFTPAQMKALGEGAAGQKINVTMNINALDARSVWQLLRENKGTIESLVVESLQRDGPIRRVIKGVT